MIVVPQKFRDALGFTGLTILITLISYAVQLSKEDGRIQYNIAVSSLLVDLFKLLVSAVLLAVQFTHAPSPRERSALVVADASVTARFAIPAVIYAINNNMSVFAASVVPPSLAVSLVQIKLVAVCLLRWALLRARPSALRLGLVTIIALGAASALAGGGRVCGTDAVAGSGEGGGASRYNLWLGVPMLFLASVLSSLAGVYSEVLLKGTPGSLNWQNFQLYAMGLLLNTGMALSGRLGTDFSFKGFNLWTWVHIFMSVFMGMSVSVILKYTSSMVKAAATPASMLLFFMTTAFVLGEVPETHVVIGSLTMVLGGILYVQYPEDHPVPNPPGVESRPPSEKSNPTTEKTVV